MDIPVPNSIAANFKGRASNQLLNHHHFIDPWYPLRYSLDTYSGCPYNCTYCRVNWRDKKKVIVKSNALDLLKKESTLLARQTGNHRGQLVGIGGGDNEVFAPFDDLETLTQVVNLLVKESHYPIVMTQNPSELVRHFEPVYKKIFLVVSFPSRELRELRELGSELQTISKTSESSLFINPPSESEKFRNMRVLKKMGVNLGAAISPIIPGFDDQDRLKNLVEKLRDIEITSVIPTALDQDGYLHLLKHNLVSQKDKENKFGREIDQKKWDTYQSRKVMEVIELIQQNDMTPFLPLSMIQNRLTPRDLTVALLGRMQILENYIHSWIGFKKNELGTRKKIDAYKYAAYGVNQIREEEFNGYLRTQSLTQVTGIGNYLAKIIYQWNYQKNFKAYHRLLGEAGITEKVV